MLHRLGRRALSQAGRQCLAVQWRCNQDRVRAGLARAASAAASSSTATSEARRDTALLLIDFQRGFITGTWAKQQGGADQVLPIADAAARLADLYATDTVSSLPSLATRFFLQSPDALPPANLDAALSAIPWVSKQGSNVMESGDFAPWLEARIAEGVTTLVVRISTPQAASDAHPHDHVHCQLSPLGSTRRAPTQALHFPTNANLCRRCVAARPHRAYGCHRKQCSVPLQTEACAW